MTNLRNEITRFQQRFDESFYEAWDPFNDLLRACPHHGFSKLHQLDTFYNALKVNDQDSLNSAAGGNFLDKMPRECLKIIESESKVCQSRAKAVVAKVNKKNQSSAPVSSPTPAPVKAVEPNCVTCGGTHSYQNYPATSRNIYRDNIQEYVSQAAAANFNQGNTGDNFNQGQLHRPQVNQPPTYQAPAYQAPIPQTQSVSQTDFECYVKANDAVLRNMQNQGQNVQNQLANLTDMLSKFMSFNTASSLGSWTLPSNTITNPKEELKDITTRSGVAYEGPTIPTPSKVIKQGTEPVVIPVSTPMPNVKYSIPYPLRHNNERRRDQVNEQIEKFYEIFKDMSFKISFTDALILMPKFASTLKALIGNKEKLSKMDRTSMNEHCSTIILNKLPRKLGDSGKFLIPCEFPGIDECLALADLGASINLMPFFMWEALSLSEHTLTCMTLELADRLVSKPISIAKDVSFKGCMFHFPVDFVVVDFEPDPRIPLILGRCFLKTGRAMIDVHKGELTLCIRNEAITYNLDQSVRYSANYNQITANKIDVIEMACEEYSQEVLSFSDVTASGNPTPHDDPIISTTSPTLTPFRDIDFLLFEEADAFLNLEDDPNSPKINPFYYDPKRDILLLEAILNSKPLPLLPNHEQYLPSFKKELKVCEAKTVKSSVDEPPEVKLKDLPPHLEYAFLVGDNKLPIIIAKELGDEEKSALIKRTRNQRYNIRDELIPRSTTSLRKKLKKLLDAGLIYSISDSPWVSLVHCVPKKGSFTVVENEENELILTRLVTGWRVCIDYQKLNEATHKDHFLIPFIDQMLEILAGNEFYCFLDGFSRYFQIPIDPRDQEKTMFTCPYGTFAYRRIPFGLCNAPGTFQRCMLAIFYDMVEKTMEVFMDDFSVFGNSFKNCLSRLDKMIEVDRSKVDVIAKLPHLITVKVLDTKGVENLATDHLSRLENPYENVLDPKGINETFPLEMLSMVTFRGDSSAPWFADFSNYHAGNFIGPFPSSRGNKYILMAVDYLSKWVEAKALPTNDARVVCKFLKSLFARFGATRAIISNRGTHFCNDQFAKIMLIYGITHRLFTAYHPQTSRQVEVSNRGLKRILKRTIGENHASW
nr:hypothetical protein [Tanacetum cinerariifolium]